MTMNAEHLLKLRNRKPLRLWDSLNKLFVHIQLNKKDERVCWERWVSKDKQNWVNWNKYLSLKDISGITAEIQENNKKTIETAN